MRGNAMARILLHYDIEDDRLRDHFNKWITNPRRFDPPFEMVTASVYTREQFVTQDKLKALKAQLLSAITDTPENVKIVLEYPTTTNRRPDIATDDVYSK